MGFLRRLLGGSAEDGPDDARPADAPTAPDPADAGDASDPGCESDPDETRARALAGAFEAGLSDLARRQLRHADRAWAPPSQLRRDGDWVLMVRWKVQSPEGKDVTLKAGSRLTYVGPGTMSEGGVRFRTEKGVLVDLPAGRVTDDGWPDDLQRPRSPTAGAEDD
jgi:hypothetical protein